MSTVPSLELKPLLVEVITGLQVNGLVGCWAQPSRILPVRPISFQMNIAGCAAVRLSRRRLLIHRSSFK